MISWPENLRRCATAALGATVAPAVMRLDVYPPARVVKRQGVAVAGRAFDLWESLGSSVPGMLAPTAFHPHVSDEQVCAAIRTLLASNGVVASSDVRQHLDVDAGCARTHFRRLAGEGHAVVDDQKRGTRYRRAES